MSIFDPSPISSQQRHSDMIGMESQIAMFRVRRAAQVYFDFCAILAGRDDVISIKEIDGVIHVEGSDRGNLHNYLEGRMRFERWLQRDGVSVVYGTHYQGAPVRLTLYKGIK